MPIHEENNSNAKPRFSPSSTHIAVPSSFLNFNAALDVPSHHLAGFVLPRSLRKHRGGCLVMVCDRYVRDRSIEVEQDVEDVEGTGVQLRVISKTIFQRRGHAMQLVSVVKNP